MKAADVTKQLKTIASADDFVGEADELVDKWSAAGAGLETVEPILRFMEEHDSLDFGMPGPLVHFVEEFYRMGYEEKLLESLQRKPIPHTLWMLNRLINGAKSAAERKKLIAVMEGVKQHPFADEETIQRAAEFLDE